jgi:hypothetical protein
MPPIRINKDAVAAELRQITKEEATADYEKLKDTSCKSPEKSKAGLKALDYFFFRERLDTKNQHHLTFYDALANPAIMARINEKIEKVRGKSVANLKEKGSLLKTQYNLFQLYYGAVNQFPPSVARYVYCKLGAKVGILDFSAGWGGRALAAMSLGIPYTGVDTNKSLKKGYEAIVKTYEPTSKIQMIWQPSETVDFSKIAYDLVFTSPPYFMIEEYKNMQAYEDKRNFIESFFVPVVTAAFKHLPKGGHMALNMPEEMYEYVRGCLPRIHMTMKLPVSQRYAKKDNTRKDSILKGADERFEYIYVWKKRTPMETRKNKSKCGVLVKKTLKK